ncbi:uncharacterized protein LOC132564824 [Ylistrum balloti]|uniref:uncharacterized protein LOC132564824 n=1 Tax=Ylistrum balloti TaxID=509963 RepID=UPI002905A587|nr:uncharacterized protein LOC132564824 [Ylistrum balloti]
MRIQLYFLSGTIAVVVVSLGTMSLIRRILRRHSNRVTNGEMAVINTDVDSLTSSESMDMVLTVLSDSTTDDSCQDTSSGTSRNVDCRRKRRKLASLIRQKSQKELKLDHKQQEIIQIDAEIREVMRMLKHIDIRDIALDEEVQFKRLELMSMFPSVTEDSEKDIRHKEAIYHRRFTNIKSAVDAKNLLTMIRTRKHALDQLELLTYRKYVSIQHDIEAKDNSTVSPLNPCRPNFDHLFSVIRERIAQQQAGGQFADFDATADDVFPTMSNSSQTTDNGTLQLRLDPTRAPPSESVV